MTTPKGTRRIFAAALALYLGWVGILTAMAITSSRRPPSQLIPPPSAEPTPAAESARP